MMVVVAAAFAHAGFSKGADHPHHISGHGGCRWNVPRHHGGDAALLHTFDEAATGTSGDQHFDAVERVGPALEIMDSLVFGEVDAGDFYRVLAGLGFEHKEAGGMTGMTGNGLKVFTGNGKLHDILQFSVESRRYIRRSC